MVVYCVFSSSDLTKFCFIFSDCLSQWDNFMSVCSDKAQRSCWGGICYVNGDTNGHEGNETVCEVAFPEDWRAEIALRLTVSERLWLPLQCLWISNKDYCTVKDNTQRQFLGVYLCIVLGFVCLFFILRRSSKQYQSRISQ